MADDLSLLFRIRGDSSGAKAAAADARQAITQLKNSATSDLKAIQSASTSSLGTITQTAGQISQSIPVVGRAVNNLSSSFTTLTDASTGAATGIAGMAGPLSIAVAGIIATTAAVAKLGTELFDLTKQTAEFQGQFVDLSQQTGVSVETLSALSVVAQTTGGSIESITASLGIFQKNLEEASTTADSKAAKAFDRLGVEVTDTEKTLRDTIAALARMPEGFRQTATALELFGRGGKQVLAIVKESNGDLDQMIEKLRGLGLVTTEQAKRADEFNDRLVLLGLAFKDIGSEAIPVVIDAIKDLQRTIDQNKDAVELLKFGIQALTALFVGPFKGAIVLGDSVIKTHKHEVGLLTEAYQILANAIRGAVAEIPKQPIPPAGQSSGIDLLKELKAFGAGRQFIPQQDLSQIKGLFKEVPKQGRAAGLDPGVQLLQQLQKELRGLEQQTRAEEIAAELLDTRFKGVNEKVKEQILLAARIIDKKREQIEADKEATELSERLERERKAAAETLSQFLQKQADDLQRAQGITKTAFDDVDDLVTEIGLLGQTLDKNQVFWLNFNASMIEATKHANELKDVLPELKLPELNFPVPGAGGELDQLGPPPEVEKRFRGLQAAIDDLGASFGNLFGASKDFAQQFGDVIGGAVNDLAQGIGSLVEQYVLLGTTGPQALRKLLAATLAHLAAEAAVKAVFQLAEGFAALFINPAEAAAHFTSAAIFGSIAGVAAIAGRAVAGNLFKPTPSGVGGASAGSSQLNPLTLNRNQPAPTRTIVLQIQSNDSHIVKVVGADFKTAGPLRELFLNDGGA